MTLARRRLLQLAAAAALPAASPFARAQAWPSRPLRLVVGYPPGGGADNAARIMGAWLAERLGQPVVIENRPGGGTNISVQAVVNAPPDGYTLLFLPSSAAINVSFYAPLPYDLLRDIVPVAAIGDFPMVLAAHPSLPAKTVAELIAYAKANPGKINMGSFGTGTVSHVAGELFKMMAGVNLLHVPYRGGAPLTVDLLTGQVQVAFDVLTTPLPHIRAGTLRALAMTGGARVDALPDVPTVAETVPGYEASVWAGLAVPKGTPAEIVERLNREVNAGLADPAVKGRLLDGAIAPKTLTTAAFGALVAAEVEKWAKVVKFAGAKPE